MSSAEKNLFEGLVRPQSIALVGISDDKNKTAGRPLVFLRNSGFQGKIYCVNPSRSTVQGEPSYKNLAELPEKPDHVFLLTNSDLAAKAVEECGILGISLVTILAGGFSESGHEGIEREKKLKAVATKYGTRLLGPSSIGVVNVASRMTLTANAAFAEPGLKPGGIFCASHSGSLIGALVSRGRSRGINFHSLVSVGGEVDLSIGEICKASLADPTIDSYILFLESLRHADKLREFAIAAAAYGKPVAAYKLGRSDIAAKLAVSHTGALAGEDYIADTLLRDCGIARVETFEGLLEIAPLLKQIPEVKRTRPLAVGVVTTTGGGAAMVVDQLGVRGVNVVSPSKDTLNKLVECGIQVGESSIVDLTLAGTRYDTMKSALEVLSNAPEFDLILAVVGSSARTQPEIAVKPIIEARNGNKILACFIVPEAVEALLLLGEADVPSFRTPEGCADAISALANRRAPVSTVQKSTSSLLQTRTLNEADAYKLLGAYGIQCAQYVVLALDDEIKELPFDYPVAVKVLHDEIAHKTEVGGVILNVCDKQELVVALRKIVGNVKDKRPDLCVAKVLVQKMSPGVGEALIGLKRDAEAGYLIMVAAGGVLTEIYQDRAMRLAPITIETARQMISEVKGFKSMDGYRGKQKGDLEAVAQALVNLSRLAIAKEVAIEEAEVNPLIVLPEGQGVIAVDGLISVR